MSDLPRLLRSLEESLSSGLAEYPGVTFRLTGYLSDDGMIPVTCYYAVDKKDGEVDIIL